MCLSLCRAANVLIPLTMKILVLMFILLMGVISFPKDEGDLQFFLHNLGLDQYIDLIIKKTLAMTCFELYEENLKAISIKILGQCLRILRAVRELAVSVDYGDVDGDCGDGKDE